MGKVHNATRLQQDRRLRRAEDVSEAFGADYLTYQYRFVEFFIEHMVDVNRAFGGDLQAAVVLAVVGQKYLGALREATAEGLSPETMPAERTSTSASRIADVTGIPRETVRRKLAALQERGWIQKSSDGTYRMVRTQGQTAARRDFTELDRRAMQRVARLFTELETLVLAQQRPFPEHDAETGTGNCPE